MRRALAHYVPRETAVLGLIESALLFAAIHAVIQAPNASALQLGVLDPAPYDGFALAAILTLLTGTIGLTIGLYRIDACLDRRRLFTTTALAATVAFAVVLVISGALHTGLSAAHTLSIAEILGAWLITMILVRLAYTFAADRVPLARRILLLGDPMQIRAVNIRLRSRHGRTFDPVILPVPEISRAVLRQHRIWGVVVASDPEGPAIAPLLDCKLRGVKILSGAAFHENYLGRIDLDTLTASDLLMGHGFGASRLGAALKRISDIVLGLLLLALSLPLMALTALAISIDSRGPVFYRQQRIGQFDKSFTLYKFRSMTVDAEAGGSPRWAQKQDPRITRAGRFIRTTRIDELPQLVNVVRGDMSLVGPRPERPHFVEQLACAIPFYRHRSYIKLGLTGWAQVNYPYGASVEDAREKLAYDLYYLKNRSIMLDAIILLSTVRVVLSREGAR